MKLLNAEKIRQKTQRLAIEILENNCDETEIILAGVNENGMAFAKMLREAMKVIDIITPKIVLMEVFINPQNPIEDKVKLSLPLKVVENKVIVMVDDVANTGRTLQFAMKPLLHILTKKIELAVLVDRMHKSFPIRANYVGIALATTLRENIEVQIRGVAVEEQAVYLRD